MLFGSMEAKLRGLILADTAVNGIYPVTNIRGLEGWGLWPHPSLGRPSRED